MSDCIPRRYLDQAARLIGAAHDEGPGEVAAVLAIVDDLRGLAITLAALVPDDQTFTELLAWNDQRYDRQTTVDRSAVHPQNVDRPLDRTLRVVGS